MQRWLICTMEFCSREAELAVPGSPSPVMWGLLRALLSRQRTSRKCYLSQKADRRQDVIRITKIFWSEFRNQTPYRDNNEAEFKGYQTQQHLSCGPASGITRVKPPCCSCCFNSSGTDLWTHCVDRRIRRMILMSSPFLFLLRKNAGMPLHPHFYIVLGRRDNPWLLFFKILLRTRG